MNVRYRFNPEGTPRPGALISQETLPLDVISTVRTEEGFRMDFGFQEIKGRMALKLLNVEPPFVYLDPRKTDVFVPGGKIAKLQEFVLASPANDVHFEPFIASEITAPVIEA